MRVMTDLKALREWQLNKQDSGKSHALLLLSNDATTSEHIQLLHAARVRCDFTLAVTDVNAQSHSETLRQLADNGCNAALLWNEKTLYPNGLCVHIGLNRDCPSTIRTPSLERFAGQFLHLRCLVEPTLTIINRHEVGKLWLTQKLCAEYFRTEEVVAIQIKPAFEWNQFLLIVLERCALAIRAGKNPLEILERGREILKRHKHHITLFDCFDLDQLTPTEPESGKHQVLWAKTRFVDKQCEAALEL